MKTKNSGAQRKMQSNGVRVIPQTDASLSNPAAPTLQRRSFFRGGTQVAVHLRGRRKPNALEAVLIRDGDAVPVRYVKRLTPAMRLAAINAMQHEVENMLAEMESVRYHQRMQTQYDYDAPIVFPVHAGSLVH
jgi:hypothetical protein